MAQIGRLRPNVPYLFRTPILRPSFADQAGAAVAAGVVTADRTDTAAVDGVTTVVVTATAIRYQTADVLGEAAGAIETFGSQVSYAEVFGEVIAFTAGDQWRADTAAVAGASTASANVLGSIPNPTRWIQRAPRGRF